MEYIVRTFIIAVLLCIFGLLWREKELYKDLYQYEKSTNKVLIQYNRNLEDSNINLVTSCADSIINRLK